jgi:hypothetical protein
LTVSGFWPALSAVFVGELIVSHRFRSSASKSKNGFAGRKIVSRRQSNQTKLQKKLNDYNNIYPAPGLSRHPPARNRSLREPTPERNLCRGMRVEFGLSIKDKVVGSGIDAGNKGLTQKPGRLPVETLARTDGFPELQIDGAAAPKPGGLSVCGAMSQQHGDGGGGNVSAPQKFVRLVGCRDPNARTGPWVRPRPAPSKR